MTVALRVAFGSEDRAYRLGARRDPISGVWYAPPSIDLAVLRDYLPDAERRWIDLLRATSNKRKAGKLAGGRGGR